MIICLGPSIASCVVMLFLFHIPQGALKGFVTCFPCNNNQIPPVHVLTWPSDFTELNIIVQGLCNALKFTLGQEREEIKVFKGAFMTMLLCQKLAYAWFKPIGNAICLV